MPEKDSKQRREKGADKGRRSFLFILPAAIFAGVAATVVTAAFRFLRPAKMIGENDWSDVAPLSELQGDRPIMRTILAEHKAGWASTVEEHFVYILPNKKNQVLSSICPHEGCNVAWRADANQFFCPCHDSYFAADGERVSGPSRRGLDPLPTREKDGRLQVKYQSYVNNTEERIARG